MNQYEVLYAVKDYDDADQFFADVGEAPRFWQASWHLESVRVIANNMIDAQKAFYRKFEADDGRECIFVKAQLIKKCQWVHRIVVAIKDNQNLNGWRIETISVKTDSETSSLNELNEFWGLVLQELKKKYHGAISQGNYVILEKKPEVCLDVED